MTALSICFARSSLSSNGSMASTPSSLLNSEARRRAPRSTSAKAPALRQGPPQSLPLCARQRGRVRELPRGCVRARLLRRARDRAHARARRSHPGDDVPARELAVAGARSPSSSHVGAARYRSASVSGFRVRIRVRIRIRLRIRLRRPIPSPIPRPSPDSDSDSVSVCGSHALASSERALDREHVRSRCARANPRWIAQHSAGVAMPEDMALGEHRFRGGVRQHRITRAAAFDGRRWVDGSEPRRSVLEVAPHQHRHAEHPEQSDHAQERGVIRSPDRHFTTQHGLHREISPLRDPRIPRSTFVRGGAKSARSASSNISAVAYPTATLVYGCGDMEQGVCNPETTSDRRNPAMRQPCAGITRPDAHAGAGMTRVSC
ncbi:MAG: hypothetical protein JWO36_5937 [Myxococcales bacterium]|nr:hypothetical protein [Myxococcales bacterium]